MRSRLLLLSVCLAGCGTTSSSGTSSNVEHPDLDYPVGEFTLTERSGRTVTQNDLRGHVWVASFIFTRCNGPCPAVTSTVASLQSEFREAPGVRFVTFTVDPARDDLSALRDYANNRNADPERWLFLTGDEATIHALMRDRFHFYVERKKEGDVRPGDEFGHSTHLALVDKRGVIRSICDGLPGEHSPELFQEQLARFKERIRELDHSE